MRASRCTTALPLPAERRRVPEAATAAFLASILALAILPAGIGAASPAVSRRNLGSLSVTPQVSVASVAPSALAAAKSLPRPMVSPRKAAAPRPVARKSRPASRPSRGAKRGGWLNALVSWYGPGFYGHTMAGGGTLRRDSMVVAHRSLPFGTRVMFSYRGHTCTAVVRDRGPYAGGRVFDLGPGTARALGFSGVGKVRYRILGR